MILRSKTCCNTALYNGPLAASVLRERDSNFKMYFLPDSAFVTLSISTLSELFPPGFGISDEQGLFYYLLKNNIDELFSSSAPQIVLSAVDFHPEKADSDYWLLSCFFFFSCHMSEWKRGRFSFGSQQRVFSNCNETSWRKCRNNSGGGRLLLLDKTEKWAFRNQGNLGVKLQAKDGICC